MYEHLSCSVSLTIFVLIYTPLITSDSEHTVVCLLTICIFSFWNTCSSLLSIFSALGCLFIEVYSIFLYILNTSLLSDICIANIFSLWELLWIFLKLYFDEERFFIFDEVNSFLCVLSMKHLSTPRLQRCSVFFKGFYSFNCVLLSIVSSFFAHSMT